MLETSQMDDTTSCLFGPKTNASKAAEDELLVWDLMSYDE
jgi:hypothetical protein